MKHLMTLAIGLSILGCGGRKVIQGGGGKVTKAGVISVWANWIKDKGEKYDIELAIQNESDSGIIVMLADLQCAKGAASGEMKHTFFNTGERTMDFTPKQTKRFRLVCKMGQKGTGDYKVVVGRVFANPENDGKTKGKVLASNIVWQAADGTAANP